MRLVGKHDGKLFGKPPLDIRSISGVLIVRLSSLGDVLMATPMAQALREALPNAQIGWVVESTCAPLVDGNPYLSRVHSWDKSFLGFIKLVRELRRERYELAIDPQGLLKSAIISLLSGARYRVGFADGREGSTFAMTHMVEKKPSLHPCDMSLQLLRALGIDASVERHKMLIPITDEERRKVNELLNSLRLSPKHFVVFAPATRWVHKHWLSNRWIELAERIYKSYGMPSVLVGGSGDLSLLNAISSRSRSPMHNFGGLLSLRESAHLIGLAGAMVGVDSFPVHVGYAMGVPTVILYGPTSSLKWRSVAGVRVIEHELPCRPCHRRPTCGGDWTCMKTITASEVMDALSGVLCSP